MTYTTENPLRVVTLCSGYDSQCLALERLKREFPPFDHELVAWAEYDPLSKTPTPYQPAQKAHNALFPQWADRNLGDITQVDWESVPKCDLLFYSTPCQSISQAGLQHGFAEGSGTRSSIIWNVRDAVKALHPKYLCMENVAAIVSAKFVDMFNLWQNALAALGYVQFPTMLNALNYGVPQNRERMFLVSIRDDEQEYPQFNAPKQMPLKKTLRDVLEQNVAEKYYLSNKMLDYFNRVDADKTHGQS